MPATMTLLEQMQPLADDGKWEAFDHGGGHHQVVVRFKNGYGASIVRWEYSYGGSAGLFELAVAHFKRKGWVICYLTPLTRDVLGWLKPADVERVLRQIAALPTNELCGHRERI